MRVQSGRSIRSLVTTACVLAATLLGTGSTLGQSAETLSGSSGPTAREAAIPVPLASSPVGFGRSTAISLLLVDTDERLQNSELESLGTGWQSGYRWIRIYQQDVPGLLGEPVQTNATGPSYTTTAAGGSDIVAPGEAGVWKLENASGIAVTVVTKTPASRVRDGWLNGYHIGTYPTAGSDRADAYAPPEYFIEVTSETQHLPVSRHLTLGQFLTKNQHDVWPKYVALDPRLIDKLELVIQELRAMGVRANRVHIMSGFRTPQYNGPGGDGRAALSRHMWGDAADVWIDSDGNGLMDDLNGDGLIDLSDAAVMLRAVDRVESKFPELVGGAGLYPETPTHGPYIHIDTRGHHSRW